MSDPTPTLVEFLIARLDEDEAAAEAAKDAPEVYGNLNDREAHAELLELARNEGASEAAGAHAARWDPARVLAECAAKRRLIELHPNDYGQCETCADEESFSDRDWSRSAKSWPCPTLIALAAPFADHPDFGAVFGD